MARRTGWILLTLGLVLAIGSGALVYVILQQQAKQVDTLIAQATAQPAPNTVSLPVAARALEPGRPLTAEDIVIKEYPVDLVPSGAVTNTVDLEQRVLIRSVDAGELIQRRLLLGESGTAISQEIRQGYVLFAFPIMDLMTQSQIIMDGDRIDLLLTLPVVTPDGTSAGRVSALTLQNIEVFKVLRATDEEGNPGEATAMLLSMEPQDAVMLKFIKDSGGTLDFALRSPLDVDDFTAPPVNDQDLNDSYLQAQ